MNSNNFQSRFPPQRQQPPSRPSMALQPFHHYPSSHQNPATTTPHNLLGNHPCPALGSSLLTHHLHQQASLDMKNYLELANAYENLRSEYDALKTNSAKSRGIYLQCNRTLRIENNKLTVEKDQIMEMNQTKTTRFEEEIKVLKEDKVEMERQLRVERSTNVSNKVTILEQQGAALTEKCDKLSERVQQLGQTEKDQDAKIRENVASLAAQEERIRRNEQGLTSLKKHLDPKAAEVNETLGKEQEINGLQQEIENLTKELLKAKNELEKMQEEIKKGNETVTQLQDELATTKTKVEGYETALQAHRVIGRGGVEFKQRFLKTQKEIELENEVKLKRTELRQANLVVANLQREIDLLKKKIENVTEVGENDKDIPGTEFNHGPPPMQEKMESRVVGPRAHAEENGKDGGCSSPKKSRMYKPSQK